MNMKKFFSLLLTLAFVMTSIPAFAAKKMPYRIYVDITNQIVMVDDFQYIGFLHAFDRLGKTIMVYQDNVFAGGIVKQQRFPNAEIV